MLVCNNIRLIQSKCNSREVRQTLIVTWSRCLARIINVLLDAERNLCKYNQRLNRTKLMQCKLCARHLCSLSLRVGQTYYGVMQCIAKHNVIISYRLQICQKVKQNIRKVTQQMKSYQSSIKIVTKQQQPKIYFYGRLLGVRRLLLRLRGVELELGG